MMIDNKNFLDGPLYIQIYKNIKEEIIRGTYKVGTLLPSESSLEKEYGVSRITVRKALSELEHDGYVKKKQGVGTIVLDNMYLEKTKGIQSYSNILKRYGENPKSIILKKEKIKSTVEISENLNIPIGSDVLFLKRLRLIDGAISAINNTYISLNNGVDFTKIKIDEDTSLYKLYEQNDLNISYADETLKVFLSDKEIEKELLITRTEPIVKRKRVTYSNKNQPIEYTINYILSQYFYFHVEIEIDK